MRALVLPVARPVLPVAAAALAALAAAGALLALVAVALPAPPAPVRSPFGVGVSEGGGGILAWTEALQAAYGRRLSEAVAALRREGGAAWLVGLAFAYGVLHAAGPGHGKAVVSAYILAGGAELRRGVAVSFGAALVQGFVALALVGGATLLAGAGPDGLKAAAGRIEAAGFLAMAAFGGWLLARKAAALAGGPGHACGPGCDHAGPGRGGLAAAVAAGLRPCSGAVLVLVLAFSQGVAGAGVAAVLAMSLGTALTTSVAAAASVYAKRLALRLAGGRPGPWGRLVLAGEAVVAALVLLLGLLLAVGMAGGAAGALSG